MEGILKSIDLHIDLLSFSSAANLHMMNDFFFRETIQIELKG